MRAKFILSTLDQYPLLKDPRGAQLPEIALVGRSNVGKSSLINHLFHEKKLAKTSSSPGKTRLLNFFVVEDLFTFVDLPGYGFAKAPKSEIEQWSKAIDRYLNERINLRLIFLLIDCRRKINLEDQAIIDWAEAKEIPLLLIYTKIDKLSQSEKSKLLKQNDSFIPYTIMNPSGRHLVEKAIKEHI